MMKENINIAGIDKVFIDNCMSKANIKNIKDVLLMTLDNNGEVFIQSKKDDKYLNFQTDFDGGEKW